MTIKELERRTGLPRTSIRFYEQEGLLTPERRENNYRDYSEDNVRTLEKIKLLRRLSLDLDAIRRLQAGELSLSRALAGQALALEGDRADLERYAQVCEELSRTETSYDDLDPEPWLAALEEKSLPLSRRVDPTEQDSIAAAPYPWRRFFARALDLSLAGILWSALQYLVLHWYWPEFGLMGFADTLVSAWGAWLFLLVLEPILLCTWGYTPGKRLLRLKVRREDGSKLDLERAVIRTAWIFLRGFALGVPLLNILCLGTCYDRCIKDQVMPWDQGLRYAVRPAGKKRAAVYAAILLLTPIPNLAIVSESWRLPNPDGPLTPEQVVENYNFLERRVESLWGERPQLSLEPDGRWRDAPPVYQDLQEGWMWLELEDSEWGPVEFSTDEDGYVTGFSVTWSPRGSSYGEKLDLWWPTTEFLPNLFLALSPGAEDWSFPWQKTFSDKRVDAVGLALALDQVDFSQTGSRLSSQREDLGGLTGTVEVLDSQGYQSTIETGRLLQEDPGNGVLVLRFTAALSD